MCLRREARGLVMASLDGLGRIDVCSTEPDDPTAAMIMNLRCANLAGCWLQLLYMQYVLLSLLLQGIIFSTAPRTPYLTPGCPTSSLLASHERLPAALWPSSPQVLTPLVSLPSHRRFQTARPRAYIFFSFQSIFHHAIAASVDFAAHKTPPSAFHCFKYSFPSMGVPDSVWLQSSATISMRLATKGVS